MDPAASGRWGVHRFECACCPTSIDEHLPPSGPPDSRPLRFRSRSSVTLCEPDAIPPVCAARVRVARAARQHVGRYASGLVLRSGAVCRHRAPSQSAHAGTGCGQARERPAASRAGDFVDRPGRLRLAAHGAGALFSPSSAAGIVVLVTRGRLVTAFRVVRRIDRRHGFLVSCRAAAAIAWYARSKEILSRHRPGAVLVSGDSHPEEVGLCGGRAGLGDSPGLRLSRLPDAVLAAVAIQPVHSRRRGGGARPKAKRAN